MSIEQTWFAVSEVVEQIAAAVAQLWPVVAPLVGVLIGALVTSRQQARTERSRLIEAKLHRLRAAFQPVLLTAWAFGDATSPGATRVPAEEDSARNEMISDAMTGLNQARVQLALETDASGLTETFQRLYAAYALYSITLADTRAGDVPPEGKRLSDKRRVVADLVSKIEADMRATLDQVERDRRR